MTRHVFIRRSRLMAVSLADWLVLLGVQAACYLATRDLPAHRRTQRPPAEPRHAGGRHRPLHLAKAFRPRSALHHGRRQACRQGLRAGPRRGPPHRPCPLDRRCPHAAAAEPHRRRFRFQRQPGLGLEHRRPRRQSGPRPPAPQTQALGAQELRAQPRRMGLPRCPPAGLHRGAAARGWRAGRHRIQVPRIRWPHRLRLRQAQGARRQGSLGLPRARWSRRRRDRRQPGRRAAPLR